MGDLAPGGERWAMGTSKDVKALQIEFVLLGPYPHCNKELEGRDTVAKQRTSFI